MNCPVCGKAHELWTTLVRWFRYVTMEPYQKGVHLEHLGDAVVICPDEAYDLAFDRTRENQPAFILPYVRSMYFRPPRYKAVKAASTVPWTETDRETAYGKTARLPFSIRVF